MASKYCEYCSNILSKGLDFCEGCGHPVESSSSSSSDAEYYNEDSWEIQTHWKPTKEWREYYG